MIRRTFDPTEVNALLNAPAIRPTVGGEGLIDVREILEDKHNICLLDDGGGALFIWRGPRVFEGHSFFTARGREAIRLGKNIIDAMDGEADMIWGATPEHLRHVRWFNRKIGFQSLGMTETPQGRCELFEKRY